jgi:hypothetical protein
VSVQTGAPLLQTRDDVAAHGFVEVQAVPAVQAVQALVVGPLHTPAAPPEVVQAVPAVEPVWSVQTGAPLEQSMVALAMQTSVDVHEAPCVHATQVDDVPLHTPVVPVVVVQPTPGELRGPSTQSGKPVVQLIEAVGAQGPLGVQVMPGVH